MLVHKFTFINRFKVGYITKPGSSSVYRTYGGSQIYEKNIIYHIYMKNVFTFLKYFKS